MKFVIISVYHFLLFKLKFVVFINWTNTYKYKYLIIFVIYDFRTLDKVTL